MASLLRETRARAAGRCPTCRPLGWLRFGGDAVVAYRGEIDDLHLATEREILALGRSLATSVGNALRDRQRADVDQTLRALEPLEPSIRIHVHDIGGHEIA